MALSPIGDEVLTVAGSSVGFTTSEITTKTLVARVLHFSGGTVYYRNTGAASDAAANGEHQLDVGDEIEVWGAPAMLAIRFIKDSGVADAKLHVQFDGEG